MDIARGNRHVSDQVMNVIDTSVQKHHSHPHIDLVSGRTVAKSENAVNELKELGFAIATVADERNGYLAAVDILCDGGSIRGQKEFKKKRK